MPQGRIIISIHAPREGCDTVSASSIRPERNFNPRTPRGVRRVITPKRSNSGEYFNPRTPRGVRRLKSPNIPCTFCNFNPRTPRGVRRYSISTTAMYMKISIHAPREGCDEPQRLKPMSGIYFNPRTPRGVRQVNGILVTLNEGVFQSTHPARGATLSSPA